MMSKLAPTTVGAEYFDWFVAALSYAGTVHEVADLDLDGGLPLRRVHFRTAAGEMKRVDEYIVRDELGEHRTLKIS